MGLWVCSVVFPGKNIANCPKISQCLRVKCALCTTAPFEHWRQCLAMRLITKGAYNLASGGCGASHPGPLREVECFYGEGDRVGAG